jgi:hypothetical protein
MLTAKDHLQASGVDRMGVSARTVIELNIKYYRGLLQSNALPGVKPLRNCSLKKKPNWPNSRPKTTNETSLIVPPEI